MTKELLHGEEIDDRLRWKIGTADRLAKKGRLPHFVLPDGEIRFDWMEVEPLIRHVRPATQGELAIA